MRFEVNQLWQSTTDGTSQAKVIAISDNGRCAKLRMITHGVGVIELNMERVEMGFQKWCLSPYTADRHRIN